MAMIKPIALSKNAFDSTNDEVFYFNSSGGNQIVKNKITIRNNSDNSIVYTNTEITYSFNQTVPSGTLINGNYYNYYFNTYDINNNESENSNVVSFYCYSTPIVSFTNLTEGETLNSGTIQFNVQYSQNESNLLNYIVLDLYNVSGTLINTSGNLYSTNIPPLVLNHIFSGLENNTSYKIKATAVSVSGITGYSSLINFNVLITKPTIFSTIDLENKCNEGYVQLKSNVVMADGICSEDNPTYITTEKIIIPSTNGNYIKWGEPYLSNNKILSLWTNKKTIQSLSINRSIDNVKWNKGFSISSSFLLSIWMYPTTLNKILTLSKSDENPMNNGYVLKLNREVPVETDPLKTAYDFVELYGYLNGECVVYQKSNYVHILNSNSYIFLKIKKDLNNYDLSIQVISRGSNNYINWGIGNSNVEYNTLTDMTWYDENFEDKINRTVISSNIESIFPLTEVKLLGGIYDNMNITSNINSIINYDTYPSWDYNTLLNCDFNNNIFGGNISILLSQLSSIKIKRRKLGSVSWISIYKKDISNYEDLNNLTIQDSYVANGKSYQWALVPVLNGDIEGDYIISNSLLVKLKGTFLSNKDNIFKLYSGVLLGNGARNINIGILQPIGLKYPIKIQNSKNNYYSNTITANIFGYNYEDTRIIDSNDVVQECNDIFNFLVSGKSFCITDWNGNIWVATCSNSPSISYTNNYGNKIGIITLSFVEQGDPESQLDLYNNGLIDVED